jgi:serine/threonine protein kinase
LKQKKKFPPSDILYLFKFSIEFILILKSIGLVHNDIKPEIYSIVMTKDGKKKLRFIDLGEFNN